MVVVSLKLSLHRYTYIYIYIYGSVRLIVCCICTKSKFPILVKQIQCVGALGGLRGQFGECHVDYVPFEIYLCSCCLLFEPKWVLNHHAFEPKYTWGSGNKHTHTPPQNFAARTWVVAFDFYFGFVVLVRVSGRGDPNACTPFISNYFIMFFASVAWYSSASRLRQ